MVGLRKVPSGVDGLDDMTGGGLPEGRPTLVCGTAGCGKTLLGMQFLVRGILDHDQPGVFVAFEETAAELSANVAALGWDLEQLQHDHKLIIDHIHLDRAQIQEAGAYDLEGLFIRLGGAIDEIGATRVVIDTLEVLFASFDDHAILRTELRRLFRWLKDRGVTAVITAERGSGALTRHGLEEYVSDCVIFLDHRITDQVSTRRLRIVKYRGSSHDTDETPFMIDATGFRVLPVGSMRLDHDASEQRVSTGIDRLDTMLAGGYFRGGSVLISGTPGSGKTTLAAATVAAACRRGERAVLFAFEESPRQLMRNMRSVGIDLRPHIDSGLLLIQAARPAMFGLEAHLAAMMRTVRDFRPDVVVIDPISAFGGDRTSRAAMLARLIDHLKHLGITAVCTSLTVGDHGLTDTDVSSVIDAWFSLGTFETNGERNRSLRIVKARGTAHSNQVRELVFSSDGITLLDVYTGTGEVLMGTARQVREADDAEAERQRRDGAALRRHELERQRAQTAAEMTALQAALDAATDALEREERAAAALEARRADETDALRRARQGDSDGTTAVGTQ